MNKLNIKRLLCLAWAQICCDAYLLTVGMWRGETKLSCVLRINSHIGLIAAVKMRGPLTSKVKVPSVTDTVVEVNTVLNLDNIQVVRVFYSSDV